MTEKEKPASQNTETSKNDESLERIASEQKDALRDRLEREEHLHNETRSESEEEALAQASELAKQSDEKNRDAIKNDSFERAHRGAPSRKQLKESFDNQIKNIREEMGPGSKAFSKVIHNPVIESVSDFIGSTLARPNALFAGSITALITVTVLYFVSKHYGFQLSGFETIGAFIVGWLAGTFYDYLSTVFRRKK